MLEYLKPTFVPPTNEQLLEAVEHAPDVVRDIYEAPVVQLSVAKSALHIAGLVDESDAAATIINKLPTHHAQAEAWASYGRTEGNELSAWNAAVLLDEEATTAEALTTDQPLYRKRYGHHNGRFDHALTVWNAFPASAVLAKTVNLIAIQEGSFHENQRLINLAAHAPADQSPYDWLSSTVDQLQTIWPVTLVDMYDLTGDTGFLSHLVHNPHTYQGRAVEEHGTRIRDALWDADMMEELEVFARRGAKDSAAQYDMLVGKPAAKEPRPLPSIQDALAIKNPVTRRRALAEAYTALAAWPLYLTKFSPVSPLPEDFVVPYAETPPPDPIKVRSLRHPFGQLIQQPKPKTEYVPIVPRGIIG